MQIDIRNFKRINSNYGYDFGDLVLYTVGQIILGICEKNEKVYRIEATQYVIIQKNGTAKSIRDLKSKIAVAMHELNIDNTLLHIDVTCSATLFPQDGQFIDQLQNNLTYAMANAKQYNTGIVFYSREILEQRNRIIRLVDALRESVTHSFAGFRLVMQPIFDAKTGELHSAEALLRWSSDDFPDVRPVEFIPILEQTRDIIKVGAWIVDKAFQYVSEWNSQNLHRKLRHININFSYIQFSDEKLMEYILAKLDEYNLPPDTLVIELTESCRIEYTDRLARILQAYRDKGVLIALDDFGTGYASLMVLKDIPANIIKLDHTMTRTIVDRPKDKSLLEFIVTYANKMNIEVCAEGVETAEILDIIKSVGATYLQGYYYDKPLEADVFFEKYIKQAVS